jgi:DNA polymerase-1
MTTKPIVLVDGSSYLYRAYYAIANRGSGPDLTDASGNPTGAILVILNMVNRLLGEYEPERIAVVFDARGKTFRNDLYAEYKANRPPMPDELRSQIEPAIAAIEALGIVVLRQPGVEADDVIGTLASLARAAGEQTIISTPDKDMTQLVDELVVIMNSMDEPLLNAAGVEKKFGVPPARIVDFLTLVGDNSDNIPGIPGVGPKTAQKWLSEHGSVDALIAHADAIGGKVGDRLRESLGSLPLYRELVTIKCDVDLPLGIENLERGPVDPARLRGILEPLGMHGFLSRILGATESRDQMPEPRHRDYVIVATDLELTTWLEKIEAADLVAVDTETTSLNYMDAELVGISLSTETASAAYIPLAHSYAGAPQQLDREYVLARLKPWLENDRLTKVGHHLKYDAHIFENYGIRLAGIAHDTMLESYVLNSIATRHDMDSVAAKYLGVKTIKYEDVAGKGAKQITFDQVAVETAAQYAAEDADVSLALHLRLWQLLEAETGLRSLYLDMERPLIEVLGAMEYAGVKVDAALLNRQSEELAAAMKTAEAAAHKAAGGPFNLGSPKQLQEILYERLGLPVLGKTPKGQPSTAEGVLAELATEYELPRRVLEYRGLSKLKSTYTDKLPREINGRTGRIHTSYHQAVAATGRLSSTDPNLQNIPIRTPEGRRIRQAFVAPPGQVLIAADYSQIELRIMAHLSRDAGLVAAFRDDQDIHRTTAAEVFGVGLEEVSDAQRRSAKAINFGLIYGMSAFGLGRQLGIERGEAQAYVDKYFERYPGVHEYMESTRQLARDQGYVSTVFGRRLYLPEIDARDAQRRQYAERSAINAPMQGTAADIIKRAMLDVYRWTQSSKIGARLIMQVHDELVLEVNSDARDAARAALTQIMESAAELTVPLKVDVGCGANWDEAH